MPDAVDFNQQVIEEFRANGGKVGGPFDGAPMVLLTTTGAKSGRKRTTPVMGYVDGEGKLYVFASKAGAPDNPDWYHNLVANPEVEVEFGTDRFGARARPLTGAQRDQVYAEQGSRFPQFLEYQQKTDRVIPVVALERAA
ncbi:MAG: nitroreductase family deazaflavin-dependent oxidoreductase [Acidimicrobiales bacterium]|nr:nitroreductase family deazaflavin-dependent oxidoreductase [Acidimicrobiales bacterium]